MNKILLYIIGICGFFLVILYFKCNYLENKNNTLETQINELSKQLKECNDGVETYIRKEEQANETIRKIRSSVRNTKVADCDCYNSKLPDGLLDIVRGKD